MSQALHPNLFPSAPVASSSAYEDGQSSTAAAEASSSASAWANSFKHRLDDDSADGNEQHSDSLSGTSLETPAKKLTRTEQVIAHLLEHGPSSSGELCRAIGIASKGGIGPFIVPAIQSGRIIRADGKYALPSAPDQMQNAAATAKAPTKTRKAREPSPPQASAKAIDVRHAPQPELVLFVDELQLLSYSDGSVVLQNAQARIEVRPRQMRAFLVLAQLRS